MAGDVAAGVRRLLDGGPQLGGPVLQRVEPVGRGGDPAGDHHLQKARALAQLVPAGAAQLVDPVGDPGQPVAAAGLPVLAGGAPVAVAAGLAQRVPAVQQPGAGDVPLVDRAGQPGVRAAGVAHRGEAAAEHPAEDPGRAQGRVRRRLARHRGEVGRPRLDVHVRVDQPGRDRRAGHVGSLGGRVRGRAGVGDRRDPVAVDHHLPARHGAPGDDVDHGHVVQDRPRHDRTVPAPRDSPASTPSAPVCRRVARLRRAAARSTGWRPSP